METGKVEVTLVDEFKKLAGCVHGMKDLVVAVDAMCLDTRDRPENIPEAPERPLAARRVVIRNTSLVVIRALLRRLADDATAAMDELEKIETIMAGTGLH